MLPPIIGIDPGMYGALAWISISGELVEVEDMPLLEKEINAHMIARLIQGYGGKVAVVEWVSARPGQSAPAMWKFGVGYGKILGVLATMEIPIVHRTPSQWKKQMRLSKDKNLSRQRATERWPGWADSFKRVKDEGRAEAALLGVSYWETHGDQYRRPSPTKRTEPVEDD